MHDRHMRIGKDVGVPVPSAMGALTLLLRRAVGHGTVSMCSDKKIERARAGCAWLSVLRVQHTVLLHNAYYSSMIIMAAPLNWSHRRCAHYLVPPRVAAQLSVPIVRHYPLKTLRVCLVPLWAAQMHAPIVRRMHPTACFWYILQATDIELIHMKVS